MYVHFISFLNIKKLAGFWDLPKEHSLFMSIIAANGLVMPRLRKNRQISYQHVDRICHEKSGETCTIKILLMMVESCSVKESLAIYMYIWVFDWANCMIKNLLSFIWIGLIANYYPSLYQVTQISIHWVAFFIKPKWHYVWLMQRDCLQRRYCHL